MAKFYPELNADLRAFIAEQKMFFTATASARGRINLSPKGIETFCCLDDRTVAYLDLTGSGNETAAHLQENGQNQGRITIMFCSFSEQPLILRLYGKGRVIFPRDAQWNQVYQNFEAWPGTRQAMLIKVESVQTSCGFGVPLYEFKEQRSRLIHWAQNKGDAGLKEYWELKNQTSIDGLPTYILTEETE